jgi:hypothetical protein
MKNIINIKEFTKLKKINEEATPRDIGDYSGGGETYFANVKGNFAGADTTIVGSAIMKIFGFIKRKINEGILLLYMNSLKREYLADILRYCQKNGLKINDPQKNYDVKLIEDSEGNKIESNYISVKFDNDNKSLLNYYNVGSKVFDKNTNIISDGVYLKKNDNTEFTVKNGIISDIVKREKVISDISTEDNIKTEKEKEVITSTETPVTNKEITPKTTADTEIKPLKTSTSNVDSDIIEYVNNLNSKIQRYGLKNKEDLKYYEDKVKYINRIIGIIDEGGLKEIENLKKSHKLSNDKKKEMDIDIEVYNKNKNLLFELKKMIQKKIDLYNKKVKSGLSNENYNEFFNDNEFDMDYNELNEEFRGINIRTGVQRKAADELSEFETNAISFYKSKIDEQFLAKQFEDQKLKQNLTNYVIENKSPIIKIQLAAERMFTDKGQYGAKLQNTWNKMVENVKGVYSRYLFVDQVDPRILIKKMTDVEIDKYNKQIINEPNSLYNKGNDLKTKALIEQNNNIGLRSRNFDKDNQTFGILSTLNGNLMYIQDTITVDGKLYHTYRLLGTVDMDKLVEDKTSQNFSNYVSYDKLPDIFLPLNNKILYDNKEMEYKTTYIVFSKENSHLSRGTSGKELGVYFTNNVFIVFLYTSEELTKLNPTEFKNKYVFYIKNITAKKDFSLVDSDYKNIPKKDYLYGLDVNVPYPIPQAYEKKYGIDNNWKNLTMKSVIDNIIGLVGLIKNK